MQYFFLVILWGAWCALHSTLISLSVTNALRKQFPDGFRYYRIIYNLIAVITLIPVLQYGFLLRGVSIVTWEGKLRIVQILIGAAGMFFFITGLRRYDLFQFLGIRQLNGENTCSVLTDDCTLDTGGVLSAVRHPWYSAGILIVWARPLDLSTLLTNLVICGYLVIGAMIEERKLTVQFGDHYKSYQRRVSMLFPFMWVRGLFSRKI